MPLDHLYEPIDESYREKSTTLQDAPQADDDEAGIDYIKMNPSFKAFDQTTEETAAKVDDYINPSFKAADQALTEETDVEDYIKMSKVVDQVVSGETESDVDDYMEMNQSFKVVNHTDTDEYIFKQQVIKIFHLQGMIIKKDKSYWNCYSSYSITYVHFVCIASYLITLFL